MRDVLGGRFEKQGLRAAFRAGWPRASQKKQLSQDFVGQRQCFPCTALTKYHRLGDFNSRDFFSYSSGGCWKPKFKVPAGSVAGENPLPALGMADLSFLTWPREGERVSSLVPSQEDTISPNHNYFPKAPPPNTKSQGRGIQVQHRTLVWGRGRVQSTAFVSFSCAKHIHPTPVAHQPCLILAATLKSHRHTI